MNRRHFFSMFTAAFVSAVAAVKVKRMYRAKDGLPTFLINRKHWYNWPLYYDKDGLVRLPRKYYRMNRTFELPITPASTP